MEDTESENLTLLQKGPLTRKSRRLVVICILLTELCERLTYYSISANLVLYCTNELGYADIEASTVYYIFTGFCYIIPIFGGWVADSIAGKFNVIYGAGLIYLIGAIILPVVSFDFENEFHRNDDYERVILEEEPHRVYFMVGLLFVAVGTGGIKANVGPFGASQMEDLGPQYVQSFFNWFYWFINVGSAVAFSVVAYLQQNVNFFVGFLVPAISMLFAIIIFMTGKNTFKDTPPGGSVLTKVLRIFVQGIKKRKEGVYKLKSFLDHAKESNGGSYVDTDVEGVKTLGRVIAIFLTFIFFWTIYAQMQSSFLLQGLRMNLGFGSWIPAASLSLFNTVIILILVPFMDLVVYPILSKHGWDFSQLKRIGTGMVLAAISVIIAGVIEIYRKEECCSEQDIAGKLYNASSISIFWQVPQFCFIGAGEVFTSITGLEYAYSQAPVELQGVVMGLFLMTTGLGNFLGIAILTIVETSTANNKEQWLPEDINDGHLEYYFFLLGILMLVNFFIYLMVVHFLRSKSLEIYIDNNYEVAYTKAEENENIHFNHVDQQINDEHGKESNENKALLQEEHVYDNTPSTSKEDEV